MTETYVTLVDYTRMRLNSKTATGRKIKVCPKCGRKGEYVRYKNGDVGVAHLGHSEFGFVSIHDHCYIRAAKA